MNFYLLLQAHSQQFKKNHKETHLWHRLLWRQVNYRLYASVKHSAWRQVLSTVSVWIHQDIGLSRVVRRGNTCTGAGLRLKHWWRGQTVHHLFQRWRRRHLHFGELQIGVYNCQIITFQHTNIPFHPKFVLSSHYRNHLDSGAVPSFQTTAYIRVVNHLKKSSC